MKSVGGAVVSSVIFSLSLRTSYEVELGGGNTKKEARSVEDALARGREERRSLRSFKARNLISLFSLTLRLLPLVLYALLIWID